MPGTANLKTAKGRVTKVPSLAIENYRDGGLKKKALLSSRNSPYPPQCLMDTGIGNVAIVYCIRVDVTETTNLKSITECLQHWGRKHMYIPTVGL